MYEINTYRKHRRIAKQELAKKGRNNCIGYLTYILIGLGLCAILTGCGTVHAGDTASGSGRGDGRKLYDIVKLEVEATSGGGEAVKDSTGKSGIGPQDTKSVGRKADSNNKSEIDKIAYAVAVAETGNCTKGYGISHNNCFGIKKGKTYPCTTKGRNKMCNFASKEESYKAFKIIWQKWYGGFPTLRMAQTWTGNDRSELWLTNVKKTYQSL